MKVKATITLKDGTLLQMTFRSFIELAAWMERKHGIYMAFDAYQVPGDESTNTGV